ncbi:MAG: hypothetical protein WC684_10935 [Hyphomicrobium sp.]|jgi:hypothetical protein
MPRLPVALAMLFAAYLPVAAEEHQPLPDKLTFGYEEEGKIDASPAGCEAATKELVEWPEPDMSDAIRQVCGARKRHVDAYAGIQKSYKALVKAIGADTRLDSATAVTSLQAMVKACIDHKSNITNGGHNISTELIPNNIAAGCLTLGKKMLDEEVAWFSDSENRSLTPP